MPTLPTPTARTVAFAMAGAALIVIGVAVGSQDVAWPAFFLAALPVVALLLTLVFRPRLRVQRRIVPTSIAAGEPATVQLRTTALRASSTTTVDAEDVPGAPLGPPHQVRVDASAAGRVTDSAYEIRPYRRGQYVLDGYRFGFGDLFGFWRWSVRVPHASALTVTPRVVALPPAHALTYGAMGETPIPQTAVSGPDDVLVREYRPRDDVRRIHWPSTARHGTLMVRREEAAWEPTAWVLLDARAGAHPVVGDERPGFEVLVSAAASIGLRLLDDGYTVTLVDTEGVRHEVAAGLPDAPASWVEPLADAEPSPAEDLSAATIRLARAGAEHRVVALLGVLDARSTDLLTAAGGPRQHRVAFVLSPPPADHADYRAEAEALAAHGWEVRALGSLDALPHAWAAEAGAP